MIGKNIKYWIKQKGYKSDYIADMMNMSIQNLYKIYQKDNMDVRLLQKFSEILGVPFYDLLNDDDPEKVYLNRVEGNLGGIVNEPGVSYGNEKELREENKELREEMQRQYEIIKNLNNYIRLLEKEQLKK